MPPVLAGALVAASLPPFSFWPAAPAGFALLISCLRHARARKRLLVGLLAGVAQFSIALLWALQFTAAGYVVLVLVESFILGLGALLAPPRGTLRVAAAAGVLSIAEWVRDSWPFGGLPLGGAALGQAGGPLAFAARLGGPLLIVLVLGLIGGGLAELFGLARRNSDFLRQAAIPTAGIALGIGLAAGGAGAALSAQVGRLSAALVQGGGRRGLDQLEVPAAHVFEAAVRETRQVKGRPRLIVWPEDVVSTGYVPFQHSHAEAVLAALARRHGATLIAGVVTDVGARRFVNEVVALSPDGRIVARYEKVHRVPFGEYVPYRSFFAHLANLSDIPRDAIAGDANGMISTPAGRFAVMISYEVFFAERGRSGVRAGGELLLVPTNTSSYSSAQAPEEELEASRLQAVEEDRFLLQVSPTGYSSVVNPSGVVLATSVLSRPAVLEATVALEKGLTPYAVFGDAPVLAGSGLMLAAGWACSLRGRKAASDASSDS